MDSPYKFVGWLDFDNHLLSVTQNLLTDDAFTDVTLVSEDHKEYKAHKVILSACSPILKKFVVVGDDPLLHKTVLYLRGIDSQYLEALLEFMYAGKTNVLRENMEEFLAIGEDLQISGLSEFTVKENVKHVENVENVATENIKYENEETKSVEDKGDETEEEEVGTSESEEIIPVEKSSSLSCKICPYTAKYRYQVKNHEAHVHGEAKYECTLCDYKATRKESFKVHSLSERHKQAQNQNGFLCNACPFKSSSQAEFQNHFRSNHRSFACNQCDYQGKQKAHLTNHIANKHSILTFKCRFCEYSSKTTYGLKIHEKTIHGNTLYHCESCSYTTKHLGAHRRHKLVMHDNNDC